MPRGFSKDDFLAHDQLPQPSYPFCDTRLGSSRPEHLRSVAEALHRKTREYLSSPRGPEERDRIDLFGMPFPIDTCDEKKAEACQTHLIAEIASRAVDQKLGPHVIPEFSDNPIWTRWLIIIDRPKKI